MSNDKCTAFGHMTVDKKLRQKRELYNSYLYFTDTIYYRHAQGLRYFATNAVVVNCNDSCQNCLRVHFSVNENPTQQTIYISNPIRLVLDTMLMLVNYKDCNYISIQTLNYMLLGKMADVTDVANHLLFTLPLFGCLVNSNQ